MTSFLSHKLTSRSHVATVFGDTNKTYLAIEDSILDIVRSQGGEIVTAEILAYAIHQMCPTYLDHPPMFHIEWARGFMDHIRKTVG